MAKKNIEFTTPPESYWVASTKSADLPALEEDLKVDVAIVGGGLVGITAAFLLKQENLTVAVIEANRVGKGTTGHTTAKITSQHGLIYDKLIKRLGLEKAQQYAMANENAVTFLESLVKNSKIDCDFSPQSAYVYTRQEQFVQQIEDEVSAASTLGIKAHYLEQIPLPFGVKAAERFDNQGQFHPRKFLLALAAGITGGGSHIFEQTRAVEFLEGHPFTVITATGHKVIADRVIFASHFPVYDGGGLYYARAFADRSYAIAIKAEEKFPGGMYITAGSPTRSLRSTPYDGSELIIIVGEHHRTGQGPPTDSHYRSLAQFAEQTFTVTELPFHWSAQDYATLDEVPYVGRLSEGSDNVYVATGFRKWGITNGTAAAILLKDLIVHGESPWEAVYDPTRFKADPSVKQAASTSLGELTQTVERRLKNVPGAEALAPGEAALAKVGEGKVGLYKDDSGRVHAVNITCTHTGCELTWNEAEHTWDCPCHGSRFTKEGDIIEGPALKTLQAEGDRFNP